MALDDFQYFTPTRLVASLRSIVCPACGGKKKVAQTLCGKDYYALPLPMRTALYKRVGEGYEKAIYDALKHLGASEFNDPPFTPTPTL